MNWNWFVSGGEIVAGVALMVALGVLIWFLRPPAGTLQEKLIVRFPGAWIVVGLPLTFLAGVSIALIAVGAGILH